MTSVPCHFSPLRSHFADCLVLELPLPINLHHCPSFASASWHLSPPFDAPTLTGSFVHPLHHLPSLSPFTLTLSPILSRPVILSYPLPW